jgi:hypothetical protein
MSSSTTNLAPPRSAPRRLRRFPSLLGAATVALAVAALAWFLRENWQSWRMRRQPNQERIEPGLANEVSAGELDDYLPEDTAALLVVDYRRLRETPGALEHVRPLLHPTSGGEGLLPQRLDLVGVEPDQDVDGVCLLNGIDDTGYPLVLLRGRFDAGRFQVGPNRLRPLTAANSAATFHVYEYGDPKGTDTGYFAVIGTDCLLFSRSKDNVLTALRQTIQPRRVPLRDAALSEALQRVDRSKAVWGAASLNRLSTMPRLKPPVVDGALRPIVEQAVRIEGELDVRDGQLRLRVRLDAASAEETDKLVQKIEELKYACEAALMLGEAGKDYPRAVEPILRLLSEARIEREGTTVTVSGSAALR